MPENESTVEMVDQSAQDDAVLAATEESPAEGNTSLSEVLGMMQEEEAQETAPTSQESEVHTKEDKVNTGLKGRLNAAEKKGFDAGRQAAMTEFQKQMKALQESIDAQNKRIEAYERRDRADAISKKYPNLPPEVAEYLTNSGFALDGKQAEAPKESVHTTPPRDEHGRFTSQKRSDDVNERANYLYQQAQTIKAMTGVDAIELYNQADAETQRKIADGELDFTFLAKNAAETTQTTTTQTQKKPLNIKSSGESGVHKTISNMTDDDIDKLNAALRGGAVIDMRR